MDSAAESFRKSLNRRLEDAGWSQNDLAKRTGVPQSNISRYCLGKSEPGISHAATICTAFGLSLDQFIGSSPTPPQLPDLSASLLPILLEIATLLPSMHKGQLDVLLATAKTFARGGNVPTEISDEAKKAR